MNSKERYTYFKKIGMCGRCGKRKPKKGKFTCEECSQQKKRLYQTRVENKLCIVCSKATIPGIIYCIDCAKKYREKDKKRKRVKSKQKFKSKDDYVVCPICFERFGSLTTHIHCEHGITIEEFKNKYPGMPLCSVNTRKRISKSSVKMWMDSNYLWNSKEFRKKVSERTKELWKDQAFRDNTLSKRRAPECLKKQSISMREHWENPESKYRSFEYRKKRVKIGKAYAKTTKFKENMRLISLKMKKHWADPEYKRTHAVFLTKVSPSRNSKIEQMLESLLRSKGLEYEDHQDVKEINAFLDQQYHEFDFVIPSLKIALEADGCWWHCCAQCFPNDSIFDKDKRIDLHKIRKRDVEINIAVQKAGWTIIRFWGHDIRKNPEKVEDELIKILKI